MYIEGVALGHFSTTDQEISSSYLHSCTLHAVFHLFMSDKIKQYAGTTAAHSEQIIELLRKKILGAGISTIW